MVLKIRVVLRKVAIEARMARAYVCSVNRTCRNLPGRRTGLGSQMTTPEQCTFVLRVGYAILWHMELNDCLANTVNMTTKQTCNSPYVSLQNNGTYS